MTSAVSVSVERPEADLLGDPLGDEARPPVAQARARAALVGAVAAMIRSGSVARPARELADDLEAQIVRPLEVLEARGWSARERGEDRSTTSMTSCRRPPMSASVAASRRSPGARAELCERRRVRSIVRARSRIDAAGTS